jgi:MHS family proline/betaine transporter-like MFS transporter
MSISYAAVLPSSVSRRTIAASVIGNVVEWFDFAVYGFLAAVIGKLFFPAIDSSASLIAALGVFAAGFLMRPLGGVVFGYVGDRFGRGIALYLSIGLMAVSTLGIGLLPTYETGGVFAPILMVACRMVQGLAVGGEYACSIVVLVETAPPRSRAFRGSWACFSATAGNMLGSAVGAILFTTLSEDQIAAWGWRLPFLSGVLVALVGVYLRRNFTMPHGAPAVGGFRFLQAVTKEGRAMLNIVGLNMVAAISFYMLYVYLVQYVHDVAHISTARALDINTLNMGILLLVMPAAGYISDRIGRKPLVYASMGLLIASSWPLFLLLHSPSELHVFLAQFGFTVIIGLYLGVVPALMVEQVPASVRCTAVATTYNLTIALFGGTAPMLCVYLIDKSGNDIVPAIYLIGAATIALLTAARMQETAFRELRR